MDLVQQIYAWLSSSMHDASAVTWTWLTDQGNAAGIQAISAVAVVFLTIAIVSFSRRQVAIARQQSELQARQVRMEDRLASMEWRPIVAAHFYPDYRTSGGTRIMLKNVGRGPAQNIRGHLWVEGKRHAFEARPTNLGADDDGQAGLTDQAVIQDFRNRVVDRAGDLDVWVIHYTDALGSVWHTTCNLNDAGWRVRPGYFRAWNQHDWQQLPLEARDLCLVCEDDASEQELARAGVQIEKERRHPERRMRRLLRYWRVVARADRTARTKDV